MAWDNMSRPDCDACLVTARHLTPQTACNQEPKHQRKGATDMSAANTTKWIGVGLLGLPLYVPVEASG